jgi:nucleoside-diphosphate-sugar epimerase
MDEAHAGPRLIALTGATGFIGRHLQDALVTGGYRIRALVRPGSTTRAHLNPEVETIDAGFDASACTQLVHGASAVIYCAGAVRGRTYRDFETANVRGVEALAAAAAQMEKPPPFLLVSSLAATRPEVSDYARSKHAGEEAIEGHTRLPWTVLRPPAVYGSGDREMLPLLRSVWRGLTPMVGGPDQRLSLIHVEDLVEAMLAWLADSSKCVHQAFELHDGRQGGYDWDSISRSAPRHRPRKFSVPRVLLSGIATLNSALSVVFRYTPMLTPGKVNELCQPDWVCDNTRFTAATQWQPTINLEQGLARLFSDCKHV